MSKKYSQSDFNRSSFFLDTVNNLSGHSVLNELNDTLDPTLGLELENEIKSTHLTGKFENYGFKSLTDWKYHNENSLRYHGFEYVSKPIRYKEAAKSIQKLFAELAENGCNPEHHTNSIRTSFHVHFNQTSRTLYETMLFVTVYYMFEPYLQDFCGKHRQNNLFCLRLQDTRTVLSQLIAAISGEKLFHQIHLSTADYRYGSVNFNSLMKFGTIEFRMMRASSDPNDLIFWIEVLHKLRKFSLTCKSFEKLRQIVADVPMSVLIENILGKDCIETLDMYLESYPTKEAAVRAGYCNILPFIVEGLGYTKEKMLDIKNEWKLHIEKVKKDMYLQAHSNNSTTLAGTPQASVNWVVGNGNPF